MDAFQQDTKNNNNAQLFITHLFQNNKNKLIFHMKTHKGGK